MTTIAYKDGILAADTQIVIGNIRWFGHKIEYIPELEWWVGGAGTSWQIEEVLNYYRSKSKKRPAKDKLDSFEAIIVPQQGVPFWLDKHMNKNIIEPNTAYAIGTGWQLAIGAMGMGMDAPTAVSVASEWDINTNNLVDVYDSHTQRLTEVTFPT